MEHGSAFTCISDLREILRCCRTMQYTDWAHNSHIHTHPYTHTHKHTQFSHLHLHTYCRLAPWLSFPDRKFSHGSGNICICENAFPYTTPTAASIHFSIYLAPVAVWFSLVSNSNIIHFILFFQRFRVIHNSMVGFPILSRMKMSRHFRWNDTIDTRYIIEHFQ